MMHTFRQFLQHAQFAHPHPFVRDFAYDALHEPSFPRTPKTYRAVKLAVSGGCRQARLGAALAWRLYVRVRDEVVAR